LESNFEQNFKQAVSKQHSEQAKFPNRLDISFRNRTYEPAMGNNTCFGRSHEETHGLREVRREAENEQVRPTKIKCLSANRHSYIGATNVAPFGQFISLDRMNSFFHLINTKKVFITAEVVAEFNGRRISKLYKRQGQRWCQCSGCTNQPSFLHCHPTAGPEVIESAEFNRRTTS